jgi:hypothetical protein
MSSPAEGICEGEEEEEEGILAFILHTFFAFSKVSAHYEVGTSHFDNHLIFSFHKGW